MKAEAAYAWLKEYHLETSYLSSMGEVTAWDQRTCLPPKGHLHRAEQLAVLARMLHERAVNPRISARLSDVEESGLVTDPVSVEAVNVREWRHAYDRSVKIPERLAVELARAAAEGEAAWERTRPDNNWKEYKVHLSRIIELQKEQADALGYEDERYDALLDGYERGVTTRSLERVFERLRQSLVELLEKIALSSVRPSVACLEREYPIGQQEQFSRRIAQAIGYDFEAGRIDTSAHPFTIGIGPGDVRITTRYMENFFSSALFGTMHETGHALYEQGLLAEHWGTPMGEASSLGIHESQSRMWENMVGRSLEFWEYVFPVARAEFSSLSDVSLEEFYRSINAVKPSLIRVEADEVTYNLHILLRFELELSLIRGELPVDDLPEAWNHKMRRYLGIESPDFAHGVMQDVHWAAGLIGYFPTYTLGNIYAAQLFHRAELELGNLVECFSRGEFSPLLDWMRKKIHQQGGRYLPRDLIKEVTKESPNADYFILYCNKKYARLYEF